MKKTLLFVLAAIFACYTMNAQTSVFSEDFEGGLAAWTTIDNDGDGNQWEITDQISVHSGSNCVVSASYINNSGPLTPDNWLVTANPITIGSGCALTWYDAAQDADWPAEKYSVYIATGNTVSDFTANQPVFTITLSDSAWTLRAVDLSAYAGQTVYVAFRHYDCTDMFMMKIDDIEISQMPTDPEIMLSSLTTPNSVDAGSPFNISGVVVNNSGAALNSFKLQYSINGTSSEVITINGLNIPLGGTYAFTHTAPVTLANVGTYTYVVSVSNPNGVADNAADNSLSGVVTVCGGVISTFPYTETFENGQGCWQTVDHDGDGNNWEYYSAAQVGVDAMVSFSYDNSTLADLDADNWLISPAIQVPENGTYYAVWYDAVLDTDYADSYSVYIGTSNDVTSLLATTPLGTITGEGSLQQRAFALSGYAGQTVYFAFRHNDSGNFGLLFTYFNVLNPEAVIDTITVLSGNETMGTVDGGGYYENGSEVTISANPKAGYRFVRWNDNNTDNPRTITVNGNATYTATFEAGTPGPVTGINDVNAADVKLFPNPTSGNLYVEVEGLQKVEIIDAVGRVVLSQNNGTVNMSNLANGIYTVRVSANGTTSIKKVVKK